VPAGFAPVEQAILVDTFPKEKLSDAFALYSMAIVTAPAVGPPLGGWIADKFSWRWVFFINVPIGLLSLLLSSRLIYGSPEFGADGDRLAAGANCASTMSGSFSSRSGSHTWKSSWTAVSATIGWAATSSRLFLYSLL